MKEKIALTTVLISSILASAADGPLPNELSRLKRNYDTAMIRELEEVQSTYISELESLKTKYTKAGDLDAALKVRKEIELAREWKTLPLEKLRLQLLEDLTQEQFSDWLLGVVIDFSGSSGAVTATFEEEHVVWKHRGQKHTHEYKVTGDRRINIDGAGTYKLTFEKNLQGGTIVSSRGEYPLRIRSKDES